MEINAGKDGFWQAKCMLDMIQDRTMFTAVVITAVLLAFQTFLYFGSEKIQYSPHDVQRGIDSRIPLAPAWVYVYVLWFPMIAFFPLTLFVFDKVMYLIYICSIAADVIISVTIYICYPTTFKRPEPPDTINGRALGLVYRYSYKGVNCMPSMHCSQCFIVMTVAVLCFSMPLGVKFIYIVISLGIVYATMATKQHVVIDVLTAVPAAFISLVAGIACLFIFC